MNIFFWSPFISEVATIKTVINSMKSIKHYSKNNNLKLNLINAFGEWDSKESIINKLEVNLINFSKIKFDKLLPNYGYFASRTKYLIIFIKSFFKLHAILKNKNTHYLFCFLVTSLPLILILFFNYNSKVILRISGFPKLNIFRLILWKLTSNKVYLVTCPTVETLEKIKKLNIFDPSKLIFLPEPVITLNEYRENKFDRIDTENFNKNNSIVAIGRLTRQKNFQFLVKSLQNILIKYKNLNFFIIGDGEEKEEIIKLIEKLNLKNRIFLLGYKKNVFPYLRACKCFILSSLWEDPGYVLIEAAFSNATIISSDCPNGPKSILQDGKAGFLFKNNSKSDFFKKFEEFINSKSKDIFKKKINAKKGIKIYTNFNHYKVIKNYLHL